MHIVYELHSKWLCHFTESNAINLENRKKSKCTRNKPKYIHTHTRLLFPINKLYKHILANIECDTFAIHVQHVYSVVHFFSTFFPTSISIAFAISNDCIAIKLLWIFNLYSFTHFG